MNLKTNWKSYIENLRKREIEIILPYLKSRNISNGLEMGAGSGYQSRLLTNYIKNLYCTELNDERLNMERANGIKYIIADAEIIDKYFKHEYFDFIFSSNLFEHLPFPQKAIKGMQKVLKTDGIAIHIIPSPFNAIVRLLLWYPNLAISILTYIFSSPKKSSIKVKKIGNNSKLNRKTSKLARFIIPQPHGVSSNIIKEIGYWRKKNWMRLFNKNGLKVNKVLKGPVSSGYGFGFNYIRNILENSGLTCEYIYIMGKEKNHV